MSYTLLLGSFVIRYSDLPNDGPEPDGDTITFHPNDKKSVKDLPRTGRAPDFSGRGNIGIRLEAIDALETHFPKGRMWRQEKEGAEKARDALLYRLGFRDIVFQGNKVLSAKNDELPGYVLANSIDPNGRVIGFIFAGGEDTARRGQLGLWRRSTADPNGPATQVNKRTIEDLVIWPKLFRRVVAFFNEGHGNLNGFETWLRKQAQHGDDDEILVLDSERLANLDDVVSASGTSLQLRLWPDEFIVEPKPAQE
ncbi:uncharacterized protein B0I36DRAFT_300707 [Microdochium trichocladiopsis]|uniref:Uncharacterized protein n=1 Tax=Microdochium trichocladiopsis TaxID=1682393 RepID=A0A9P8XS27_9PEZI|nr:uncharacterized protein B0I36DRAFT_300707 [Microdochium trichocladiopsis]KAH7007927.1 hypothetical protein B0I36DRAFT_300707 [Microdochium trichocladiopsis]